MTQVNGAAPVIAVVPLRGGSNSKTRLSEALDVQDRTRLVAVLARHVVEALVRTLTVERVVVVTTDPLFAGRALGPVDSSVQIVRQPHHVRGLNPAVRYGCDQAAVGSHQRLLVVHADLPALTRDDVQVLLDQPEPVTLAPDRMGTGTNAVALDDARGGFTFRFGPDSFAAHRDEGARLGLDTAVVESVGSGVDLDTPEDWAALPTQVRQRLVRDVPGTAALG